MVEAIGNTEELGQTVQQKQLLRPLLFWDVTWCR